jgi:C-terminal processing protease CtpA/Prc
MITYLYTYLKHKRWFVLFLLITFCFTSNAQQSNNIALKKYSEEELIQDYNYFKVLLTKCHPGLTRYTTADSMEYWFNYYRTQISDSMTQRQFRKIMNKPIEKIKCGHTGTTYSAALSRYLAKTKFKLLPIDVAVNNRKLYIIKNNSADTTLRVLDEIASINGHSVQQMLTTFDSYMSADGNILTGKENIFNSNFARFYRGLVDTAITQVIETKSLKNSVITHTVTCVVPKDEPSTSESQQTLTYLHDSIAILDLNSFAGYSQRKFISKTFKELNEKKINNLVLDLRDNGGGQVLTALQVLSYLLPQPTMLEARRNNKIIPFYGYMRGKLMIKLSNKALNQTKHKTIDSLYYAYLPIRKAKNNFYKGKLFVLVNGGSFSASVITAAYLKRYERATIIGQETGGTENGCNAFTMPMVIAPNTGMGLRLPLYQVNNILPNYNYGRGVMPNYVVNENLVLPCSTHDACLQSVITLLGK